MIKYTYSNGVLINKLGIKDQEELTEVESTVTDIQAENVKDMQVPLTFEGLQSIHKHLFSEIYSWAGEPRVSNLAKENTFTPPNKIMEEATKVFDDFESKNRLQGLKREEFAVEAAHLFGQINNIHPFREGNGRTQRLFLEEVAKQAGHELNFEPLTKERMIQASIDYISGNPKKMEEMFIEISDHQKIKNLQSVNKFLIEGIGEDIWNSLYVTNAHHGNTYEGIFVGKDKNDFVIQLRGHNNDAEENSIVVADIKDFKYLNDTNPQVGQKIILDIPAIEKEKVVESEKLIKAKPGRTYTGNIIDVTDTYIIQKSKTGKIYQHESANISGINEDSINKEFKIMYQANGEAKAEEKQAKQKDDKSLDVKIDNNLGLD